MRLAGLAGLVGGALSMACGEYISVSSQKDAEEADVEKERQEQMKGPEARRKEFEELVAIYMAVRGAMLLAAAVVVVVVVVVVVNCLLQWLLRLLYCHLDGLLAARLPILTNLRRPRKTMPLLLQKQQNGHAPQRGLAEATARQVAHELTEADVIRAHARDELGIDIDDLANPLQASVASAAAFSLGAAIPLAAGAFILDAQLRLGAVLAAAVAGLALFGGSGAWLGGASVARGSLRVLVGGLLAMGCTFGIGRLFGSQVAV